MSSAKMKKGELGFQDTLLGLYLEITFKICFLKCLQLLSSWSLSTLYLYNPPGQGPVQPVLGDPVMAGGLDYMTH